LGILFPSILCTCPNQRNLFKLTVSIIVGFLTLAWISQFVNILKFTDILTQNDSSRNAQVNVSGNACPNVIYYYTSCLRPVPFLRKLMVRLT
jgi:hypothetical protein